MTARTLVMECFGSCPSPNSQTNTKISPSPVMRNGKGGGGGGGSRACAKVSRKGQTLCSRTVNEICTDVCVSTQGTEQHEKSCSVTPLLNRDYSDEKKNILDELISSSGSCSLTPNGGQTLIYSRKAVVKRAIRRSVWRAPALAAPA